MPDDLDTRAQAFLAAAEKATEGPWTLVETGATDLPWFVGFQAHKEGGWEKDSTLMDKANAVFIVASHNDAPALVRDLMAEVKRLRSHTAPT